MRVVDLFAGCGGLSLGFLNAGFEVVAAFDHWEKAVEVYRANFGHPVFKYDLSEIESSIQAVVPYAPEMIIGGPPCQDFSHAGKRSEGHRANLTVAFAEIVTSRELKPLWFVMENVDRAQNSSAFRDAQRIFERAGYGLSTVVLDASLCGVPQRRKRFVCIGKLGEDPGFMMHHINSRLAPNPMTVRQYFGEQLNAEYYYRHPRNYSRRAIYSVDEPAATIRGVNRPIPLGYKGHPSDPASYKDARPLTTEERAQIQTFPRDYQWIGSKTDREQMIGNAVPVKLAEFIGNCIMTYSAESAIVNLQLPFKSSLGDDNGRIQGVARAISEIG